MKHRAKALLLVSAAQIFLMQQAHSYSNTFNDEFNKIQNYINQEMRRMDDDFWGRSRIQSRFDRKWEKPHSTQNLVDRKIENVKDRLARLKTLTEQHEEYLEQLKKQQKALNRSDESVAQNNFNMTDNHDDGSYKALFTLPGFKENNLKIHVNHRKNKLTITGTIEKIHDKTSDNMKVTTYQKFSMYHNVNEKKKELNFDNGNLEINIDLPDNINTENFTTTFDNNELSIKFKIQE